MGGVQYGWTRPSVRGSPHERDDDGCVSRVDGVPQNARLGVAGAPRAKEPSQLQGMQLRYNPMQGRHAHQEKTQSCCSDDPWALWGTQEWPHGHEVGFVEY